MKITLSDVGSIPQNPTSAATTINDNFAIIQDAFDNTLSRDGTSPNPMENNLDMNNFHILNLPTPIANTDPVRLSDLNTLNGGGTITTIPSGGTTGQVLAKNSNASYDVSWTSESAEVAAGTNIAVTGTSPATISTIASPVFTGVKLNGLTVSSAVATDSGKNLVSVTNTGTGNNVLSTSPSLTTPSLGTATSTGLVITNNTATALCVGVNGATNPTLNVNSSNISGATGVTLQSSTAGSGFFIATTSSATDEALNINAKGAGTLRVNTTGTGATSLGNPTGGLSLAGTTTCAGALRSNAATSGIGYSTGAGGTVTQATNRTTSVTLNTVSGAITLFSQVNSAVSAATAQTFTLTNSAIAVTDTVYVAQKSGTDKYMIFVTNIQAGSCQITNFTTGGTTNEAPVFKFVVIKAVEA